MLAGRHLLNFSPGFMPCWNCPSRVHSVAVRQFASVEYLFHANILDADGEEPRRHKTLIPATVANEGKRSAAMSIVQNEGYLPMAPFLGYTIPRYNPSVPRPHAPGSKE